MAAYFRWTPVVCGALLMCHLSPPAACAEETYEDVKAVLQTVPDDLYPANGEKWTKTKADAANQILQEKVLSHEATLTFNVKDTGH